MTPQQLDVLRQFQRLRVRFLVVGGQAMRAYRIDRTTSDLDLWVARDNENARALEQFTKNSPNAPSLQRLQEPSLKLSIGDPSRPEVDILNSVAGDPSFVDCHARSFRAHIDGRPLPVVAAIDLRAIKNATAQIMYADQRNPNLSPDEQESARRTAEKERRDMMLLDQFLLTQSIRR
jgi:hypothetical protein